MTRTEWRNFAMDCIMAAARVAGCRGARNLHAARAILMTSPVLVHPDQAAGCGLVQRERDRAARIAGRREFLDVVDARQAPALHAAPHRLVVVIQVGLSVRAQ